MTSRPPIHLGSGEPVLLLHGFLMSQTVWDPVAPRLADTGRYEVFAPTMAGHNGGPYAGTWLLSSSVLADHVERQLDELGWDSAHMVGNSLGGWVAFELERRGRARSVTGVGAAGGWTRWSPVKFEVISKFVAGMPLLALARLFNQRVLALPLSRRLATLPLTATPGGISERQLCGVVDDAAHCPAYFQLLAKSILDPGLLQLAETEVPVQLVLCEKDRVVPASRFNRHFTKFLPPGTKITQLDGVGHVPMFEAPERVAAVISDFIDEVAPQTPAVNRLDPPAS
jgi:pimeloyl-ACP methyl ester carboxylesterase